MATLKIFFVFIKFVYYSCVEVSELTHEIKIWLIIHRLNMNFLRRNSVSFWFNDSLTKSSRTKQKLNERSNITGESKKNSEKITSYKLAYDGLKLWICDLITWIVGKSRVNLFETFSPIWQWTFSDLVGRAKLGFKAYWKVDGWRYRRGWVWKTALTFL